MSNSAANALASISRSSVPLGRNSVAAQGAFIDMYGLRKLLGVEHDVSQFMGYREPLPVGMVLGIDSDHKNTILDQCHAGEPVVEWS